MEMGREKGRGDEKGTEGKREGGRKERNSVGPALYATDMKCHRIFMVPRRGF